MTDSTIPWALSDEVAEALCSMVAPSPALPAGDASHSEARRSVGKWLNECPQRAPDLRDIATLCADYDRLSALSKQVSAGDAPEFKRPDAGHPLLQRLIDSIAIESGKACWDYLAMYEVRDELARQGQADSTGGKA